MLRKRKRIFEIELTSAFTGRTHVIKEYFSNAGSAIAFCVLSYCKYASCKLKGVELNKGGVIKIDGYTLDLDSLPIQGRIMFLKKWYEGY